MATFLVKNVAFFRPVLESVSKLQCFWGMFVGNKNKVLSRTLFVGLKKVAFLSFVAISSAPRFYPCADSYGDFVDPAIFCPFENFTDPFFYQCDTLVFPVVNKWVNNLNV